MIKKIGCLAVIGIIAFIVLIVKSVANSPSVDVKIDPTERPNEMTVKMMFAKSLRNYLNDPKSYEPRDIRTGEHKKGYAFIHSFRAKNAFNATVKNVCALLYQTNATPNWIFYNQDQVDAFLDEVTVDGMPVKK